jgi:hypothetical protein
MHEHKDFLKKIATTPWLPRLLTLLPKPPTYLPSLFRSNIILDGMEGVGCELFQHLERFGIYLGLKIIFVYKIFETFISILNFFVSCLEISFFWGEKKYVISRNFNFTSRIYFSKFGNKNLKK